MSHFRASSAHPAENTEKRASAVCSDVCVLCLKSTVSGDNTQMASLLLNGKWHLPFHFVYLLPNSLPPPNSNQTMQQSLSTRVCRKDPPLQLPPVVPKQVCPLITHSRNLIFCMDPTLKPATESSYLSS